ncbi:Uncharacterised protein [Yersinia nurmii]|uniref:Uncharacterized protein n=1 Tax=Yersinia nurmii TaxID=685706 RepID=A0ABP1YDJ9_9GAMM|nr:Uncharacterised protein [Yersinia nurmii]
MKRWSFFVIDITIKTDDYAIPILSPAFEPLGVIR